MQRRISWRPAVGIGTPLLILSVAVAVACSDRPATAPLDDQWSEQALVSLAVRAEIASIQGPSVHRSGPIHGTAEFPVFKGATQSPSLRFKGDSSKAKPEVRHIRAKNKRLYSMGRIGSKDGAPSKRVYFFEDGRIRAVIDQEHSRFGRGWVVKSSRISLFDSTGRPQAQVAARTDSNAVARALTPFRQPAVADALFAVVRLMSLRELHAAEEEGGCTSEWFATAAASLIVAELLAAFSAEVATCVAGGPAAVVACPLVTPTLAKLLAAIGALSLAWDKLDECKRKARAAAEAAGGTSNVRPRPEEDEERPDLVDAVEGFIEDAEASGAFSCTSDGNYCVYYAT